MRRLDVERRAVPNQVMMPLAIGRRGRQVEELRPRLAGELRHVANEGGAESAAGDEDLASARVRLRA